MNFKYGCDKANECHCADDHCRTAVFSKDGMIGTGLDPSKRWLYCQGWKETLGMVFDKDLGAYVLPEWREELLRRVGR